MTDELVEAVAKLIDRNAFAYSDQRPNLMQSRVAAALSKARAIIPLVREAERADKWQDISTAPKHTLCLLFEPHDDGGFCFVGCTNMDGDWVNNLDLQVQHPTLWSPLDAPGEHTQESQP